MKERCAEVHDMLKRSWADHNLLRLRPRDEEEPHLVDSAGERDYAAGKALLDAEEEWVTGHLKACQHCRGEVSDMGHLDRTLLDGLTTLQDLVGPPSEECVDETLRRVREGSPEATLIRRIRRPIRILLWGVFYAFTLLACCLLAVALYKAIRGLS